MWKFFQKPMQVMHTSTADMESHQGYVCTQADLWLEYTQMSSSFFAWNNVIKMVLRQHCIKPEMFTYVLYRHVHLYFATARDHIICDEILVQQNILSIYIRKLIFTNRFCKFSQNCLFARVTWTFLDLHYEISLQNHCQICVNEHSGLWIHHDNFHASSSSSHVWIVFLLQTWGLCWLCHPMNHMHRSVMKRTRRGNNCYQSSKTKIQRRLTLWQSIMKYHKNDICNQLLCWVVQLYMPCKHY